MTRRLFLVFLALYLLTASGRIDSGDGFTMYQVTDSMMNGRGFAIPDTPPDQDFLGARGERIPREVLSGSGYGAYGVDGRYYAKYGPGQSFAAIPFYLLGKLTHAALPAWSEEFWTRTGVTWLNAVVTALMVALVFETARLFFTQPTALALAILFGLATPAWPYAKSFFSEPLLGGLMLLSGYAAMRARRDPGAGWCALSGAALGGALLVKPTTIIIAPIIGGYVLLVCRPRWKLWLGAWALGLALWAFYNYVRFGNPLTTGYSLLRWDTPIYIGIYGLLFSPGKGLAWFAPLIVLGVASAPALIRRAKAEGWLFVGVAGTFIVLHSVYDSWDGGGGWGPRLIVPIVAWLVLPFGVILERRLRPAWQELGLAIIIAASVLVQVLGVSVNYARHLQAVYDTSRSSEEYFERVQFHWADSPIAGQVHELLAVTGNLRRADIQPELHALVERTLRSTAPNPADPSYDARAEALGLLAFNVPDYWPVYAWLLGAPAGAIAAVMIILIGVEAASMWLLYAEVRRQPG